MSTFYFLFHYRMVNWFIQTSSENLLFPQNNKNWIWLNIENCRKFRIMCRIPGTWYDSSTVNISVEEFCQHRKKKKSCPLLLNNHASNCRTIVPVTIKQSSSDCSTIVPATVEQLCQPLLKNRASLCWTIVPATVEHSCQRLLNIRASVRWRIMLVTGEESC